MAGGMERESRGDDSIRKSIPTYMRIPLKGLYEEGNKDCGRIGTDRKNRQSIELRR